MRWHSLAVRGWAGDGLAMGWLAYKDGDEEGWTAQKVRGLTPEA